MDKPQQKVLIIEDDVPILHSISDKFTHEGFFVIKAGNGQDGLEKALKEHPDFTLVDNYMPYTDGFYFLENLRKDEWGKDARVIMWSNARDSEATVRAKKLGILYFMVKGEWEYPDMVKKVKEYLDDKVIK